MANSENPIQPRKNEAPRQGKSGDWHITVGKPRLGSVTLCGLTTLRVDEMAPTGDPVGDYAERCALCEELYQLELDLND